MATSIPQQIALEYTGSFRPILYGILMWIVTVYAFRCGGWAEKLAAAANVAMSYATPLLLRAYEVRYQHIELPVLIVDISYMILMVGIVLRSPKFWPMWLAAMQGLTVMAHLLPFMPHARAFLYYNAATLWSYPMWIVLGFAIRRHDLERRQRLSAEQKDGSGIATT